MLTNILIARLLYNNINIGGHLVYLFRGILKFVISEIFWKNLILRNFKDFYF